MTNGPTSSFGDIGAKLLALLDSVSVFTILAIAVAGAAVLALPSPLLSIDLSPVRGGTTGAVIAGAVILSGCLVAAKVARAAQEAYSAHFEQGNARPLWSSRKIFRVGTAINRRLARHASSFARSSYKSKYSSRTNDCTHRTLSSHPLRNFLAALMCKFCNSG
jgi:hypothetical protein